MAAALTLDSLRGRTLTFIAAEDDARLVDRRDSRPNCVELIAEELGADRRDVSNALVSLKGSGLIERETTEGPGPLTTRAVWLTDKGRAQVMSEAVIDPGPFELHQQDVVAALALRTAVEVVGMYVNDDEAVVYVLDDHNGHRIAVTAGG